MEGFNFIQRKQELESEIAILKSQLEEKKKILESLLQTQKYHSLSSRDLVKYSRQIIVPSIGVKGQEKIKAASVLIVGCGGLGCPAAQYLVGCGVGKLGLVDYDIVEENNLHRQLLHTEENVGILKVKSASQALKRLNKQVIIDEHAILLDSKTALNIVSQYDIVVDASDNVATRYLINDACVLCNKPLVSGSAVRTEGQLTVLNFENGPCYRCLFPKPPPPETVTNCGDAGVLGPRVIGVLQALQVIYIILGSDKILSRRLLLLDGMDTQFRTIKLRDKVKSCEVCGQSPTINKLIDYEQFCGSPANDKDPALKLLATNERISPEELFNCIINNSPPLILDVRSKLEFQMCNLPGSINIPLGDLSNCNIRNFLDTKLKEKSAFKSVCVVCRRGNDSQLGVLRLKEQLKEIHLCDLKGGLHAWAREIDKSFPIY